MSSTKLTCSLCDVSFDTSQEQRLHAKSETHVQALRRRAAASGLITLPAANDFSVPVSSDESTPSEDEISYSEAESATEGETEDFNLKNCIFCHHSSASLDETILHMETKHGLGIPYQEHLIVDLETMIWYLHFIVFKYRECILCGIRRRTVEAIQQHMNDKGHCRIELDEEILEFYDLEGLGSHHINNSIQVDSESLRLPSGKILSHRTAASAKPRHRTIAEEGEEDQGCPATISADSSSNAVSTRERKDAALASQLARLSVKDQQSLIHLPVSQQRSFLLQRKKEMDAAQRAERRMQLKTERLSNRTMMKHFANDVPGRANG
ncbi:hypothetical protein F66182_6075 [Fusarium sp. NRRL 66182]|nr:hypothetical protein F66182_6075 [Fusarium sp. NRRL 66182]